MNHLEFLETLEAVIGERVEDEPEGSYTAHLARAGVRKVAQKVGEEGVEVALAGAGESAERVVDEAADLIYHLLVLLQLRDLSLADVVRELERRHH